MSVDGLTKKLKAVFLVLKDSKKALIILSAGFLVFVFLISLLQNQQGKKPPQKAEIAPPPVVPLFESPLLPDEPALTETYDFFRKPGHEFNDEEVGRWFSPPDGAIFEELHRANTAIANDILGGVP